MAGCSHKTNSRLNRHMLKSTPTQGQRCLIATPASHLLCLLCKARPVPLPQRPAHQFTQPYEWRAGCFACVCLRIPAFNSNRNRTLHFIAPKHIHNPPRQACNTRSADITHCISSHQPQQSLRMIIPSL